MLSGPHKLRFLPLILPRPNSPAFGRNSSIHTRFHQTRTRSVHSVSFDGTGRAEKVEIAVDKPKTVSTKSPERQAEPFNSDVLPLLTRTLTSFTLTNKVALITG